MNSRFALANGLLLLLIVLATAACGGETATTVNQPTGAPAPAAPATGADKAPGGGVAATTPDWQRKIIRNATLTLTVASVEDSLAAVRDIANQAGGFVFSSDSHYQGDDLTAAVTIQVPVDTFDQVMTSLRRLGTKVVSETSTSQDVTAEYVDLTAQIKNLQAQEDQVRALMDKATTLQDTLTVENQLSQIQGQIEQGQGRLNVLDRQTSFSSVTVNLQPKVVAAPPPPSFAWQPDTTAARAWDASLVVLSKIGDVLITAVVFSWWWLPLLLVLLLLWRRQRRQRRVGGPSAPQVPM